MISRITRKIKSLFLPGSFARNVSIIAGATLGVQVLATLVSPLITRLYSPADYGVFAAFTSISGILLAVNSLRYEFAIPLPADEGKAFDLLSLSLALVAVTSLIFLFVLWSLRYQIGEWSNTPAIAELIWLMPLVLLFNGFYMALNYWAVRRKGYAVVARSKVVDGIGTNLARIGFGVLQAGSLGLIVSQALGLFGGACSLLLYLKKSGGHPIRDVRWRNLYQAAIEYRRFPLVSMWSSLLNTVGSNLPTLLMISVYGPVIGGVFAFGQRIAAIPLDLIASSVAQVYLGTASNIRHTKPTTLNSLFKKTIARLFTVGLLPIAVLFIWGPEIFTWVFGPSWQSAGYFVRLLAPALLARFVASPISMTLIILENQGTQLLWDIARLTLTIVIFGVAPLASWAPEKTLAAYSLLLLGAYLVLLVLNWYSIRRHLLNETHIQALQPQ